MKVGIIGNRTFNNKDFFLEKIENLKLEITFDLIVSGGAKGADTFGELYALKNNIPTKIFIPDWSKGRGAGHIRNTDIVNNSELIIAFWDEISPGTKNSVEKAMKSNKKIIIYNFTNNTEKRINF